MPVFAARFEQDRWKMKIKKSGDSAAEGDGDGNGNGNGNGGTSETGDYRSHHTTRKQTPTNTPSMIASRRFFADIFDMSILTPGTREAAPKIR